MSSVIDIKGLDKAALLAALYNGAKAQELGWLHFNPKPMTRDEARDVIGEQGLDFDYLKGRVMKVSLEGDQLDPWLYDRDNGEGSAAKIVASVKDGAEPALENSRELGGERGDFSEAACPATEHPVGSAAWGDALLRRALEEVYARLSSPHSGEDGPG